MAKIHRSRKQKIFYINFETIYVIEKMRPGGNFNCHKKKKKNTFIIITRSNLQFFLTPKTFHI